VSINRSGKTIKTVSGVIRIANKAAIPVTVSPPGTDSTGSNPKIAPVQAGAPQTEVKLPSDIDDAAVGGGGRFLILHLRKLRQLAIFDTSAAKVVNFLPLDSDNILFAAGAEKLMVVSVDQNTISRYNLLSLEREAIVPMPVTGIINAIAMGANSQGPLLVLASKGTEPQSSTAFSLVDPNTMTLKDTLSKVANHYRSYLYKIHIRASADGTVFCMWSPDSMPSGLQTMIIEGNNAQSWHISSSLGLTIPSPDSRIIHTSGYTYTVEGKIRNRTASGMLRIPAMRGNLYLEIDPEGGITVRLPGEDYVLAALPQINDISDVSRNLSIGLGNFPLYPMPVAAAPRQNTQLDRDKRIYFIPNAHLIVVIPATKDRLILYPFELPQVLKDSPSDYLWVSSAPIVSAERNSNYVY
jgi:hypothetical protein